ncbi:hypothetical protein [Pseudoclavibacter terrae]|uniref:hypothetical protein n=1 Tax=Pseudoclavibacter terrae TaxID=1530195 RepID=UPI00232C24B2|nr:hypothetical protein [Pseudoclavibacter terrae]
MAEESDGIEEAFEGQMRMVAMTAARAGEMFARGREDAKRRLEQEFRRQESELASRFEAEMRVARAQYADVQRPEWWDRATPDQIGERFQTARAWRNEDPEAAVAESKIRHEVGRRYGIEIPEQNILVSGVQVGAAVQGSLDQEQAAAERTRAERERTEAMLLDADASRDDRDADEARSAAEFEADPNERERATQEAAQRDSESVTARGQGEVLYDSAERRDATARDLESRGIDPDAIKARMHQDIGQGTPPSAAVANGGPKRAPKARAPRGKVGPQAELGR